MEITDVKVIPVDDEKLKAFVSIVFDHCFVVTDIKVIHGPKGLFVSMPSKKRKDGTFKDIAHPLNNQMRQYLEEAALAEAPALREQARRMRTVLLEGGARLAALSGSGASYFGLFEGARKAARAREALLAGGFRAQVARTLTLDQYRGAWGRTRGR